MAYAKSFCLLLLTRQWGLRTKAYRKCILARGMHHHLRGPMCGRELQKNSFSAMFMEQKERSLESQVIEVKSDGVKNPKKMTP